VQEIASQLRGISLFRLPTPASYAVAGALFMVSLVGFSDSVYATSARLRALSGGDHLEDDHNVQRWYGSLADYPNLVILESGEFTISEGWQSPSGRQLSGPSIGAHFNLDSTGRWGTAAVYVDSYQNDLHPGSLVRDSMKSSFTAIWSRRYGAIQPALVLRHAGESGAEDWQRSRTDYGFGIRLDLSPGAYLDFATEIRSYREEEGGISIATSDNYGFRTRAFIQLSETMALVPVADYVHEDRPQPAFVENGSRHLNGHVAKIGLGLNWYKDPDHLLLATVDYSDGLEFYGEGALTDEGLAASVSQDWRSTSFTLGLETRYTYWFTMRMSGVFRQLETRPKLGNNSRTDALNVNLGAAIQFADYDFDFTVSDTRPRSFAQTPFSTAAIDEEIWFTFSLRKRW